MLPLDATADVLERLLDSSDAALRAKVLVDLLDRPADDPVVAGRSATSEKPWVRATLAAHHGDGPCHMPSRRRVLRLA
jgi:hypothetical protein